MTYIGQRITSKLAAPHKLTFILNFTDRCPYHVISYISEDHP